MTTAPSDPDVDRLKQEALTLALAAKPSKNFHAFARALWEVHRREPSFLHDVESKSRMKRRALFYLANVGKLIDDYNITEAQAEKIGWTKLQVIARHAAKLPRKASQRVMGANLRLAEDLPAYELPGALKGQGRSPGGRTRSVLLRLSADEYDLLEAALISFGAQKLGRGLRHKEEAIISMARSVAPTTARSL